VNLVLFEPHEVAGSSTVSVSGARAEHLLKVLHAVPGRQVRVGVADGPLGTGTVESVGDRSVELRCTFDEAAPPRPRIDLLLALPRPKVMRRLWAQLAALGVGRIMLTNAARVERDYFDAHTLQPEHYRPLLIEGLQQARDTHLPIVSVHKQFKVLLEDALDSLFAGGLRLVADPRGDASIASVVRAQASNRVLLAVGPEGGWNDFERRLLETHGFQTATMGRRTLRSDTACIALLALVQSGLLE
jgi:RsmE family RNA methyltransferase